jgi:hypothetical protein
VRLRLLGVAAVGRPIVAGWSYGWLAQVSFTDDSWTAPLDVRRLAPTDDVHPLAAEQIRDLLGRLHADGPPQPHVFDTGDDPEKLARELADPDGARRGAGPAAERAVLLPRSGAAAAHRPPETAPAEVGLRRPDDLVGADGGAPRGSRTVRGGAGVGLGRRASEDGGSSYPGALGIPGPSSTGR